MSDGTPIATIYVRRTGQGEAVFDVELADWLEVIPVKEANELLKVATRSLEDAGMPYYFRLQGPEGQPQG